MLGRYRFSHDLVRETLYDDLSPGPRARLHRRIAQVIEEVYATSVEAHLAELAFHYVEAAQGGDATLVEGDVERAGPKAIDYARRAGDQAARSLAYEEADRLYRMALAGLDFTDSPDEQMRTEVLLALGEVQARAGGLDKARATFLKAAAIARTTGVADHLGQAALGYGGRLQWARPGHDQLLIPMLQDALVMLGGSDTRLRVRLLTRLACAWRSSPERRSDSATLSQQAVQLARELDDPATLSYALAGRYWAIWWPENPTERHPIVTELVAIAEALGDGERLIDAHMILFFDHGQLGHIAEARNTVEAVTRLANELRQPAQLWLAVSQRAWLALMDGDFRLAEELVQRETDPQVPITAARDNESVGRIHRFLLRREQGRLAEEEATVRASVEDFPWYPFHRASLACLLLDLDRGAEARTVFDDLARDEFRALYRDNEWLLGISLASEACSLLADRSAAAILYEQLEPFAGRHGAAVPDGSVGAVDRYLGLLAAPLDRFDDAVRHLMAAIDLNRAMGARPWTAHTQHDLAQVLKRRSAPGDLERAAEFDTAALGTARTIGMVLAQQIGAGDATSLASAETPLTSGTFRREGEYWTVVFGQDTFRVRDAKGMRHLARLLEAPGREVHALDLARFEASTPDASRVDDPSLTAAGLGDAGPLLDPGAKAAYRERLDELRDELTEAESWNDPERAARLQAEADALTHELAAAMRLGGHDRSAASAAERARISVTRAIRGGLVRIGEQSEPLSAHLAATIHTGTFCSYTPDPRAPITWQL